MFRLHHADQLEPLLGALASVLRAAPDDPFAPELIVVPAVGMRDAVSAGLAGRLGIAANIEFVFPGQFLARALGDGAPALPTDTNPWQLPGLAWSVLAALSTGAHAVPGVEQSTIVDRHVPDGWRRARRIADLFDRYATQRAPLIEAWASNRSNYGDGIAGADGTQAALGEGHRWQPRLWRAVQALIGSPSPAERLTTSLGSLRSGTTDPSLPARVSVFGVGSLTPTMMQVLEALAHRHEVHVFLRHPSQALWRGSTPGLGNRLVPRGPSDGSAAVQHPLLASWGRAAIESAARWHGLPGVEEVDHSAAVPDHPSSVLAALQQGIRADRAPEQLDVLTPDASLQVHACHGLTRQLEVLRDALGHLFMADPTLQPHEVLVLCTDVKAVAPLVAPVLQRGDLPVPVALGDRGLTTDESAVETISAALALVAGRATLSDVLAFVEYPSVQRRFGWGAEHTEQLAEWATALGACWGLDTQHRLAWHLPETVHEGTWRAVVDQMLAGVACAAPAPRVVLGNVAPFDEVATDGFAVVGGIADLLERLVDLHGEVQATQPVTAWLDLLGRVADDFCAFDPRDPSARAEVLRALSDIEDAARVPSDPEHCHDMPLALDDLRAILDEHVAEHAGRVPLRTGAVTVTSLVPLHGVSARVVCIVGLDDGALRSGTFDNDDVLGLRPCIGERHPRHESRQLLLDAVLAASEHLVITCNGADLTTNAEVPFTVPVQELLDVVDALLPAEAGTVVTRHPRHGFGERALMPGGLMPGAREAFTFDPAMLIAAEAKRVASSGLVERRSWTRPAIPVPEVDLDDLTAVVTNPARVYVRSRLDMNLTAQEDAASDGLPLKPDGLTSSALMRELLDAHRNQIDTRDWFLAAAARGGMPPAELGRQVLDEINAAVDALIECAATWDVPLRGLDEVRIDLPLDAGTGHEATGPLPLHVRLQGIQRRGTETRVVALEAKKLKVTDPLALALKVAALQIHLPDTPCAGVQVGFDDKGRPTGNALRFRGTGHERVQHAGRFLAMAAQCWEWALRDAVPLFAQTSAHLAAGKTTKAAGSLEDDLKYDTHGQLLWPELTFDELLGFELLESDPTPLHALAAAAGHTRRAELAAAWLWGTHRACTEALDSDGNATDDPVADDEDDAP